MNKEITVGTYNEFKEQVDRKDFKIAQIVVDSILKNLKTKKSNVHIISVNCVEEDISYDLTLERKHFAETLQDNLKYFVEREMYEKCSVIVEAINQLSKK